MQEETRDPVATVDRLDLKKALAAVKPAVCKRAGAMPVLQSVRLAAEADRVMVTATDLDLTISVPVPTVGFVTQGVALAGHADVAAMVKGATAKASGPVTITADNAEQSVIFDAGKRSRVLRTFSVDDYPRLAVIDTAERWETVVDVDVFADVIGAASADEARPILCAVHIAAEDGRIAATDSYRLYLTDGGWSMPEGSGDLLIPRRVVAEWVRRGGTALVEWDRRNISATFTDGAVVTGRMVEGEFPNYRGLIPHHWPAGYSFGSAAEVLGAVKDVRTIARTAPATPIRLSVAPDGVRIGMEVTDVGSDAVTVTGCERPFEDRTAEAGHDWRSVPEVSAWNPDYLAEILSDLPASDPFVWEVTDHLKPGGVRFTRNGRSLTRILMPVRC